MNTFQPLPLSALTASALLLCTLTAGATAQVAPTLLAPHAGSTTFDITNPVLAAVGTRIETAAFFKLANNAPGEWTVGLTITNFAGDNDLHLGLWSPNPGGTPSLVLTSEAAACNSASGEYLLQLEPSQGLLAVFDRFAPGSGTFQGIFLSARTAAGTAFGAPIPIQGVQATNGWGDPSLGYVDGQLMLFYGGSGVHPTLGTLPAILMAPIDLTNPAVPQAGAPVPVAFPVSNRTPHSPTPFVGPDGDVEGLQLSEVNFGTGDSDLYFADDLDPLTPHVLTFDTPGWLNGGGYAGGYFATGDFGANYLRLREAPVAWLIGDCEPMVTGGIQVDVATGSPHVGGGVPNITFLVASFTLTTPTPAPAGVLGDLGIGGTLLNLAVVQPAVAADEVATWSAALPYTPWAAGTVLFLQGAALQLTTGVAMLTNTAKIVL